ncbi:MAG TPA: YciI family protein [Ktedonosporobacter sp.]|nr:YciI family protein [Ktedonosporobacter sp.]
MKYLLLLCGRPQDLEAWAALPEEERARGRALATRWMDAHPQIRRTFGLQLPHTITSVHPGPNGRPLVTDGPFLEGTEVIGGLVEIEVADLDEVLQFARAWVAGGPAHPVVEIWPMIEEDYGS